MPPQTSLYHSIISPFSSCPPLPCTYYSFSFFFPHPDLFRDAPTLVLNGSTRSPPSLRSFSWLRLLWNCPAPYFPPSTSYSHLIFNSAFRNITPPVRLTRIFFPSSSPTPFFRLFYFDDLLPDTFLFFPCRFSVSLFKVFPLAPPISKLKFLYAPKRDS